jgi:hypothetical protein
MNLDPSGALMGQEAPRRQLRQGYYFELGGTIVLNRE